MMNLKALESLSQHFPDTDLYPVLFLGHGNPMNAIEDNVFSRGWAEIGKKVPHPTAVLCISAHWETQGTCATVSKNPRTIHDFGGFPDELYAVKYPAPGSEHLAIITQELLTPTPVGLDEKWGLDHGCWSVLNHVFPKADVPVIQLSLDRRISPEAHYDLAGRLAGLRRKGILIIGSGNIVHNLMKMNFYQPEARFDWAIEAEALLKNFVLNGDHQALIQYHKLGTAVELAIPTPEHYLPLIYTLAMITSQDKIQVFNDQTVAGSISMSSFCFGG